MMQIENVPGRGGMRTTAKTLQAIAPSVYALLRSTAWSAQHLAV